MKPSEVLRLMKEARDIFQNMGMEARFNSHGGGTLRAGARRWAYWERMAETAKAKLDRAIGLAEEDG